MNLLTLVPRRRPPAPPAGLPGLDSVEVSPSDLVVNGAFRTTLAVTGYPRDVRGGWLEPVVTHPGPVDVALHVEPLPTQLAATRLRRQLGRLESSRRLGADRGRLADPSLDAAAEDARELAERLARGEGRLFSVGLYATVRAGDRETLVEETSRVRSLLGALLLDTAPASFRQLQGWLTTLPLGLDLLRMRRTMDTEALAAAFPLASAELPDASGVLYGTNAHSLGLVCWDRFAQPNHNLVILARSGAGKSYLAKLDALRWACRGVEVHVVDPEDEYGRLADAVGGTVLRLGAPGVRLNPFDLPADGDPEAVVRRALFVHTLVGVLLDEPLTSAERAALDAAILAAYAAKGISSDPRTHRRPAPLLADLIHALAAEGSDVARGLAGRLAPFVTGAHRMLFDGATTTPPGGHFVVFSLRNLPDELKSAGTLLALDAIWRTVADPANRRPRLVVVDEAWLLMRDPAGAKFLYKLAKSARKHWAGLTVVTQDAADLLGTDLGQAVVANAATQILLRQAPQAIDGLAAGFRLSQGECAFLLAAQQGEALLCGGGERVAFRSLASDTEHELVRSEPQTEFSDPDDDRDAA